MLHLYELKHIRSVTRVNDNLNRNRIDFFLPN